jgi:hypothetical protein
MLLGILSGPHGSRLGAALLPFLTFQWFGSERMSRRLPMQDLLYIALTIIAFGVLWLLVKGVERFER